LLVTCDRLVVFSEYSTIKTYRHDITEILLKVALNTINQAKPNYMLGVSTLSVFGFFYQILAPEFIPSFFSGVRVTRSFVLYVCSVDRCLFFCTFSFGHLVCFSSICGLWLPPFDIFKVFLELTDWTFLSAILQINHV
jgi:hypothetical protein